MRVLPEQDTFRRAGADAIPPYPPTSPTMLARDGREHRVHRDLVGNAFAPARIDRYRPTVDRLTAGLLNSLARRAARSRSTSNSPCPSLSASSAA